MVLVSAHVVATGCFGFQDNGCSVQVHACLYAWVLQEAAPGGPEILDKRLPRHCVFRLLASEARALLGGVGVALISCPGPLLDLGPGPAPENRLSVAPEIGHDFVPRKWAPICASKCEARLLGFTL